MTDRRDDGFTVTELMITLMLMTIVSVLLLNFLIGTTNITAMADRDTAAESDAQLAIRVMSQDIRAANPILDACGAGYANCLQFDMPRPTDTHADCVSRITYRLASDAVVQDRTDTNCATNEGWTSRKIVDVVNATQSPAVALFSYLDRLDRPISLTQACASDPASSPCVKQARTVRIALVKTYVGQQTRPLKFNASVSLRNNR